MKVSSSFEQAEGRTRKLTLLFVSTLPLPRRLVLVPFLLILSERKLGLVLLLRLLLLDFDLPSSSRFQTTKRTSRRTPNPTTTNTKPNPSRESVSDLGESRTEREGRGEGETRRDESSLWLLSSQHELLLLQRLPPLLEILQVHQSDRRLLELLIHRLDVSDESLRSGGLLLGFLQAAKEGEEGQLDGRR